MKFLVRSFTLVLVMLAFTSVEAKTVKYELTQLNSNNGPVQYPGLNFFNAKSAVLTIAKGPLPSDTQLTSLEITFPNVAKLTATNFQLVNGGKYRAIVSGAWVYKEVIVELDNNPFVANAPMMINVFVSEKTSFINPQVESQGSLLFMAFGFMHDITPTNIVDTASVTVSGKKVDLSLKDRLGINELGRGAPGGFKVDALWYGKGVKTLYLPAPASPSEFDNFEVIGLIIDGTTDADLFASVKFKNNNSAEMISPRVLLKALLDQAYAP